VQFLTSMESGSFARSLSDDSSPMSAPSRPLTTGFSPQTAAKAACLASSALRDGRVASRGPLHRLRTRMAEDAPATAPHPTPRAERDRSAVGRLACERGPS
jgi:hypothetical protein